MSSQRPELFQYAQAPTEVPASTTEEEAELEEEANVQDLEILKNIEELMNGTSTLLLQQRDEDTPSDSSIDSNPIPAGITADDDKLWNHETHFSKAIINLEEASARIMTNRPSEAVFSEANRKFQRNSNTSNEVIISSMKRLYYPLNFDLIGVMQPDHDITGTVRKMQAETSTQTELAAAKASSYVARAMQSHKEKVAKEKKKAIARNHPSN